MSAGLDPTFRFDIEHIAVTEFGIGIDGRGQSFFAVPVDKKIQNALQDMVRETIRVLASGGEGETQVQPRKYNPAELYSSEEYVVLPIKSQFAAFIRQIHQAENLPYNARVLEQPASIFCYFARLTDRKKKRLTAIRRAAQFKGVLKARLVRLVTDSLTMVEDKIFKLDTEFDLLVDETSIHILHPSSFEFLGKTKEAVLEAVPENITIIQAAMPYVDFRSIEKYARKHSRAARYLASIKALGGIEKTDKALLLQWCQKTGVVVNEKNGQFIVKAGYEMDFLELLDRRRYEIELIPHQPERFRAMSRRRLERE
jgi:hypothetical protein